MAETKDLRAYKAGQRSVEKRDKHRHHRRAAVHLLPDLLGVAGVSELFFAPGEGTNGASAYDSAKSWVQGNPYGLQEAASNVWLSAKTNYATIIGLIAGGMALKWVGKKTGLNRIGTKEVRIL